MDGPGTAVITSYSIHYTKLYDDFDHRQPIIVAGHIIGVLGPMHLDHIFPGWAVLGSDGYGDSGGGIGSYNFV